MIDDREWLEADGLGGFASGTATNSPPDPLSWKERGNQKMK
jgi:hypothetical protein